MANREYKSDVFSMLLEDKCHALELYNAMAGTDYIDPDIVEICTLEKGVSLTMQTCHTLKDYTTFVEHVKDKLIEYGKTRDGYAQAVSDAIDYCIEENILKEFFLNRREEVQKAMIFDFTYEKQMDNAKKVWYQDGKEEGRVEGREEGREEGLEQGDKRRLVSQIVKKLGKNKSYDQIVDELEIEDTDIRKLYEIIVKHAPEYDMDVILQEYRQLEV